MSNARIYDDTKKIPNRSFSIVYCVRGEHGGRGGWSIRNLTIFNCRTFDLDGLSADGASYDGQSNIAIISQAAIEIMKPMKNRFDILETV